MSYEQMIKNGKVYNDFLSICPRTKKYLDYNISAISLRVIAEDTGVEMTPDLRYTKVPLNNDKTHLFYQSGKADVFRIKIVIDKDDRIKGHFHEEYDVNVPSNVINMTGNENILNDETFIGIGTTHEVIDYTDELSLITVLDYFAKNGVLLNIVTEAIDIPNGVYVITDNPKRVQKYKNNTIWELEFTRWTGDTSISWKFNNTYTNKAIAAYKKSKSKTAKAKAKTKSSTPTKTKLKKCTKCKIQYSKSKKVCVCTKYMQTILKNKKFYNSTVDGWFGSKTKEAVKKFQQKYKKKYKLSVNGKVDKKTINAICSI